MNQKQEEIKTLRAMADATLTIQALDRVADKAKKLGLFKYVYKSIGRNNSRLQGKQFHRPSVYVNKETGTTELVSAGRVVGDPYKTARNLCEEGFKFRRVVK